MSDDERKGWDKLTPDQQNATAVAARLCEEAGMRFVFLLFNDDGMGAVISNIAPANALPMIAQAHRAAKANVDVNPIDDGRSKMQ